MAEFLNPYPFDVLIAATHWLGGWDIASPDQSSELEIRGLHQSYEDYFRIQLQLALLGLFDVIAHADVIKKFGYVPDSPPLELYDDLASAAATSGVAVEVSTAGLHHPINKIYPSEPLLQRFFDTGLPVTLALDAHVPHHCGRDSKRAVRFARSVGYTQKIEFTGGVRTTVPPVSK